VTELEIRREGDTLLLRPVRPTWLSFAGEPHADADFLVERPAVVEPGRFDLPGADDDARTESDR
jgi:antitoxin VapB